VIKLTEKKEKTEKVPRIRTRAGDDCSDRSWLGDHEPRPGIEKPGPGPVGVADVDVLSAGLRFHRAQFGVSERAEERKQSADHPRKVDELGRAHGLHHLGGHEKNSAADNRPDNHRGGVAHAQIAREFRTRSSQMRDLMCALSHVGVGVYARITIL
jgi:hypothetical protein